jgi:hypothetical protein
MARTASSEPRLRFWAPFNLGPLPLLALTVGTVVHFLLNVGRRIHGLTVLDYSVAVASPSATPA